MVNLMTSNNRWLVLLVLSSALLLITIDMTVLYTALPRLTHDLGATASEKLWIIDTYPLVVAGLLPGLGTLGDRLGHKRLFLAGLAVFGVASLVAAYSPSAAALIAARAFLAVGAAMMMPATLSIIRLTFEDERERSIAIGIWAAVASGGAAVGPMIGGFLLEYYWWGSVFLINVPIVLVALVFGVVFIENRPGNAARPWDLVGSIQILIGLIGIAYAIKGLSKPEPAWAAMAAAAVLGVGALIAFGRRQARQTHKLIDFSLFRNARFSAGVATALVASMALIGAELVFTQRFQLVLGWSPLETALFVLPIPIASFLAGPLTGFVLPRVGAANMLSAATFVAGLGLALYLVSHNGAIVTQIAGFVILGFGVGAAMTASSSVIMLSAPADRAGMAASIEEVSFELGGALGIAILGSIMSAVYSFTLVVPDGVAAPATVYDSLDHALIAAGELGDRAAPLLANAYAAFERAFIAVTATAAGLLILTALIVRISTRTAERVDAGENAVGRSL